MMLRTIEGCEFDPTATSWRVRTSTERLMFNFALPLADQGMRDALRDAVARTLTRLRPERSHQILNQSRVLIRHAAPRRKGPVRLLEAADFETYRDALPCRLRYLAAEMLESLRFLNRAGFTGFAEDLRQALPDLRVVVQPKASPANLACPRDGALTPIELKWVVGSLQRAFAEGRVALPNYALTILSLAIAPRPGQMALLKVGDFTIQHTADGGKRHFVAMPLNKVRRTGDEPRRARPRRVHPAIGAVLEDLCRDAIVRGAELGIPPAKCPVFPRYFNKQRVSDWPNLPWTVGHVSASDLSARAISTFHSLDLSSMRAADPEQRITMTRLRRTLATIGRGAGLNYEQVGDLLFHPDGSTAWRYCGPTYGFIARVEEAIDFQPMADSYRHAIAAAGPNIWDA